jgi:cytosine/adenosine deaminase-related metal-dependent hydrolase
MLDTRWLAMHLNIRSRDEHEFVRKRKMHVAECWIVQGFLARGYFHIRTMPLATSSINLSIHIFSTIDFFLHIDVKK